jgi:hypothetical protein
VPYRVPLASDLRRRESPFPFRALALSGSMKKDAGNRPGSVRGQVGGLREGPLVSLCAQAEPVDLR